MEKVCHTGFRVFFMTSVLWQMVNLAKKRGKVSDPNPRKADSRSTEGPAG